MSSGNPGDRRQFGRRPTRVDAHVVVEGHGSRPCLLLNLSEHGAFLQLNEPLTLPALFRVVIADAKIDVACAARHRTEHGIGVKFYGGTVAALVSRLGGTTRESDLAPPSAPSRDMDRASGNDLRATFIRGPLGQPTGFRSISNVPGRIIRGN